MNDECRACAYSLLCLTGRFHEDWDLLWRCKGCGIASWGIVPQFGAPTPKLLAHCTMRKPAKKEKMSLCRKCYWKRELEEDERHEEALRKGEVKPRYPDKWG
jgi:hypothetical protein